MDNAFKYVNLIYGRGITDLLREMPLYFTLLSKYTSIKLFHVKTPLYASVDVNNICNLYCTHCHWWLNRKEEDKDDLFAEQWRQIIKSSFKRRNHIFFVTLIGGEPMLRPGIIEVFCEEMSKRVCVVTNGTFPLKRYDGLYFYWVSIDGSEKIHDSIREWNSIQGHSPRISASCYSYNDRLYHGAPATSRNNLRRYNN
jgi:sulfatase maturation enzyme AslB (radical SAM superfamily)